MKRLCKEEINGQEQTKRKKLAELLVNKKAMSLILGFLKPTKINARERAKNMEEELKQKNNPVGKELLKD